MPIRVKISGVKRVWSAKSGKTYFYHRKSMTRVQAEFGTAAFVAEVERLDRAFATKTSAKGTFGHLVDAYRGTPEFKRLRPVTKAMYERVLASLANLESMPLSKIDRPFVVTLRNKAYDKHKRRFANLVLQVLSRMFGIGIDLGLVDSNPAAKINKVLKPTGERNRNRRWTSAERDAVLTAAPIQLKAPLAFMRYLGARLGDVRNMPADAYRDGMITFVTSKGGVEVTVPCPEPLAKILDERIPGGRHLFVTSQGTPWTDGGWNASFRKLRERLEVAGKVGPGLTAHGLRHSVATDLRELGKTDREIADVLGQKTTYATPIYHRTADMKRSNARVLADLHGPPSGQNRSEEMENSVANSIAEAP
ncbi:tyrosine-type recombinase/integrase [Methylobacterium sp. P31]